MYPDGGKGSVQPRILMGMAHAMAEKQSSTLDKDALGAGISSLIHGL